MTASKMCLVTGIATFVVSVWWSIVIMTSCCHVDIILADFWKSSIFFSSLWLLHDPDSASAPSPSPPRFICHDNLDCSLNGVCEEEDHLHPYKKCKCDKPWQGERCERLQFKPVTFPQGYGMAPNISSTWGGGVIYNSVGKEYHMFVSRMTNDCLLEHWTTNSRIDHAVSQKATGPYTFQNVAIDTWSHNAAPIVLSDGTFAIFHIGLGVGGPTGGINCTSSTSSAITSSPDDVFSAVDDDAARNKSKSVGIMGSMIHVASSLDGPWTPLANANNILGKCNNPAPWVHPNGTYIYVGCGGLLKRATTIAGPYETIATFPMAMLGGGEGEENGLPPPPLHYEDPQIYTDDRGNFHCLYHVYTTNLPSSDCVHSIVSAHAFSTDGITDWQMSPFPPYGTQLLLSTGETITLATRERPKPFFTTPTSGRRMLTHLLQGVCGSPFCETPQSHAGCVDCKYKQWDYTLVAPLDNNIGDKNEQ
jgi:hypothetical protein